MGKLRSSKLSHKLSASLISSDWEKVAVHLNPYEESKCSCYVEMYGKLTDDPTSNWRKHPHRICCCLVQDHKSYCFHLKLFDLERESYGNVSDPVMDLKLFPACAYDINDKLLLSFTGHKYTVGILPKEPQEVQNVFMTLVEFAIGDWKYRTRKPDAKAIDGAIRLLKSEDIRKGVEELGHEYSGVHTRSELKDLIHSRFGWSHDTDFKKPSQSSGGLDNGVSITGQWYRALFDGLGEQLRTAQAGLSNPRITKEGEEDNNKDVMEKASEDASLQKVNLALHAVGQPSSTSSSQVEPEHQRSSTKRTEEPAKTPTYGGEGDVDSETTVPSQERVGQATENHRTQPTETWAQEEFLTLFTEIREEVSSSNLLSYQPSIISFRRVTEPPKATAPRTELTHEVITSKIDDVIRREFAKGSSARAEIKRLLEERPHQKLHEDGKEKVRFLRKKKRTEDRESTPVKKSTTAPLRKSARFLLKHDTNSDEDSTSMEERQYRQALRSRVAKSRSNGDDKRVDNADPKSNIASDNHDLSMAGLEPKVTLIPKQTARLDENTSAFSGRVRGAQKHRTQNEAKDVKTERDGLERNIRKRMEEVAKEVNAHDSCSSCDIASNEQEK